MITVNVNGKTQQTSSQSTLEDLINQLGLSAKRIAVEMNGQIIPKSQHKNTPLTEHATLEIVVAVGGG